MLQEVKDLQQRAVSELLQKVKGNRDELTFRAPTGSGKTRMMADFMNHMLAERSDVVFLVSTLSKGNLAQQNYDTFKMCADNATFPHLKPHLHRNKWRRKPLHPIGQQRVCAATRLVQEKRTTHAGTDAQFPS